MAAFNGRGAVVGKGAELLSRPRVKRVTVERAGFEIILRTTKKTRLDFYSSASNAKKAADEDLTPEIRRRLFCRILFD